jgi:hypothetical protein
MLLGEFVLKTVRHHLSYKERLALIYLAAVGDWVNTKSLVAAINSTKEVETQSTDFVRRLTDLGLVERKGSQARGYWYKVKS